MSNRAIHLGPWAKAALRRLPWLIASAAAITTFTEAQTALPKLQAISLSPTYLIPSSVPPQAQRFLVALGDRLQKPGKERISLTGQYSDKSSNVPAKLTWEAPGNLRFDRTGAGLPPLVFSKTTGIPAGLALSAADLDLFESLLDDRPETFLYSFYNGGVSRFLGNRFRTDNGHTPNYTGPWYDIFQANGPVLALGLAVTRTKLYVFDSQTGLLASTTYTTTQGAATQTISTQYTGWNQQNGQAVPGQIVRTVNGATEFTFKVNSASISPSAADGIFAKP